MLLQHLAEGLAEDAHAAAMDDADARKPGEEGAVDEFFNFCGSLIDGLTDHVDFRRNIGAFAL